MANDLLLVGSMPLETAEDVFQYLGRSLGPYLRAMPDGEVGERQYWVLRMAFRVFNGHPELETIKRPRPDNGVERLISRGLDDYWNFRVRDGVQAVRFGDPGWRLGYARDAVNSYALFRRMKAEGLIPQGVRFQVSLPLTNSVVTTRTFGAADLPKVRPGFTTAMRAEAAKIVAMIPNDDLAIQFDGSWEITDIYGGLPDMPAGDAIERNVAQIRELAPEIPAAVDLGYHLCFGTFGGWPRFAPNDLGRAVEFANAIIAASGRRVDWMHIPTLDRTDDAFYAPLAKLDPRGARVYLGLIHNMPSFEARLRVARKFLADFGIAAYCGMGRLTPQELEAALKDHLEALRISKQRA